MKNAKRICIVCPAGCHLDIADDGTSVTVTGNRCPRGRQYAENEMRDPKRTLTFMVRMPGGDPAYLPVKSSAPLPVSLIPEAISVLRSMTITGKVKCGDILITDFRGSGVDIVLTRGN